MSKPDTMLWLDDHRGVYIPQDFAQSFADRAKHVTGVTDEEWAILEDGPDHEWYWDTWNDVEQSAIVTDDNGVEYTLWQEGALWLIPQGMEWNDRTDSFDWPDEREEETND